MIKKSLIFSLFTLVFATVFGQNRYMDSLLDEASRSVSPNDILQINNTLIEIYRTSEDSDKAQALIDQQLLLAKKEKNLLEVVKAYVQRGVIYTNTKEYLQAQVYVDSALATAQQLNTQPAMAYASYLQAYLKLQLLENDAVTKISQKALSDIEHTNENLLKAKLSYNLYSVYTEWNDLKNTMYYAGKTIEYAELAGNKNAQSNAYSAMAVAYTYQYNVSQDKKDMDLVLQYSEKAQNLYNQFPGQVSVRAYVVALINEASYLLRYHPKLSPEIRSKIDKNANEAINSGKNVKQFAALHASTFGILSELAKHDGDINLAEKYLLYAYTLMKQDKDTPYYHTMINVVRELANLYAQKKDYPKAFEFQQEVNSYSDLLFDQSQAETSKRLEAQYQAEKKEREVAALIQNTERLKNQKYLFIALIITGVIGSFFMFRSYNFRLRYLIIKEKQLQTEMHDAEMQMRLEKEEQARLTAEKELMALQQQKLQDEVMANQLQIEHKNKVLQQVKEKLKKDEDLNINQIIREENLLDSDFEKMQFSIQEIHPNFFNLLNENAVQKLTTLDLKYCACIYLNMSTKQIANLLNVEPKSVRMSKYRLKKKFDIPADKELLSFLQNIVNKN